MSIESPTTAESHVQDSDEGESLHKYAFKLSVLVMVAALIGLAPAGVFFRSPTFLIVLVAIGTIGSFLSFQGQAKTLEYRPGWFEFMLAALYAVSFWAFLGVAWLAAFRVIELLLKAAGLIYSPLSSRAYSIAANTSFLLSALLAIGVAIVIAESVTRRFFAGEISSRATYYFRALREQSRTGVYVLTSLSALAVMGVLLWRLGSGGSFWMYLGLQFVPYVFVLWLVRFGVRARADSEVFIAVVRLLESIGYQTVISPHSQDTIMDRLLSGVDLIAYNDRHSFIVKVKTQSGSSEPVDWTVGSALDNKVKALAFYNLRSQMHIPYLAQRHVHPLMVLCGRTANESLVEFSTEQRVPVVTLDMKEIDEVIEGEDREQMRRLATERFAVLETCDAVPMPAMAMAGQEAPEWQ